MEKIEKVFEQIGKEIAEMKEATIAREVAKTIGELLRDNGVVVNITECTCDDVTETSFSRKYGVVITGLDFSEHDKTFEDAVSELGHTVSVLEGAIDTLRSRCTENARELFDRNCYGGLTIVCHSKEIEFENKQLKQRIAELESKENIIEVRVPASPIEIATHLINNTCTINELKMIEEYINVYCNGGK